MMSACPRLEHTNSDSSRDTSSSADSVSDMSEWKALQLADKCNLQFNPSLTFHEHKRVMG